MRLVDDEEPDARLVEGLGEAGRGEALGRDVEQADVAADRSIEGGAIDRGVLLGVDEADAAGRDRGERLDLVLHQRDER